MNAKVDEQARLISPQSRDAHSGTERLTDANILQNCRVVGLAPFDSASAEVIPSSVQRDAAFRKVGLALLPIFFLLNCLNFLDRTNLSFASIPLAADLNLSPSQYGLGSGLFFIGYSFFQIPSQIILERVGAPIWLATIVTLWGAAEMSMAGINSATYFYVARFLLGVAESGSFPGSWVYMAAFYPDSRITFPFSIMESAIMVAQVIGAPVAVLLLRLDGTAGMSGWQWLFLLEGAATTLLGLSLYFILPSSPRDAPWLTRSEAAAVQAEVDSCRGLREVSSNSWHLILAALLNRPLWHITAVKFMKGLTSAGAMFWTPLIIQTLLHTRAGEGSACDAWQHDKAQGKASLVQRHDYRAVLLTGVPFAMAAFACVVVARHSQAAKERVKHIGIPYILAGCAFALLPVLTQIHAFIGFLGLTATITLSLSANGALVSLTSAVAAMQGENMAINLAMCNSWSDMSGLMGPLLLGVVVEITCSYNVAFMVLGGMLILGGLLALLIEDPAYSHHLRKGKDSAGECEMSSILDEPVLK